MFAQYCFGFYNENSSSTIISYDNMAITKPSLNYINQNITSPCYNILCKNKNLVIHKILCWRTHTNIMNYTHKILPMPIENFFD